MTDLDAFDVLLSVTIQPTENKDLSVLMSSFDLHSASVSKLRYDKLFLASKNSLRMRL